MLLDALFHVEKGLLSPPLKNVMEEALPICIMNSLPLQLIGKQTCDDLDSSRSHHLLQ
jgi:hypothetical protein